MLTLQFSITAQEPSTTASLTLEQLVKIAQISNVSLKQQEISSTRSGIAVTSAKHQFLPTVEASIADRYQYIQSGDFDSQGNSVTMSLGASINLFNGFKDMSTLEKAQILQNSSSALYQWKVESVSYETAIYYFSVLGYTEAVKLAENKVRLEEELLSIVEKKMNAGEQTKADYLRQLSETETQRQSLITAKRSHTLSISTLKQYLDYGVKDDLEVDNSFSTDELVKKITQEQTEQETTEAIKNLRYDIQALQLELDAFNESYSVTKSEYWPTLDLGASISNGYSDDVIQSISDQLNGDNVNGTLSLTLSYKIFNKFSTTDKLNDIKEQISTKELEYKESVRDIDYEILEAQEYLNSAIAQLKSATIALEYATEAWRLTKKSFESGLVTNADVTSARNILIDAESNLLTSKYSIIIKWLDYKFYNGKILEAITLK